MHDSSLLGRSDISIPAVQCSVYYHESAGVHYNMLFVFVRRVLVSMYAVAATV